MKTGFVQAYAARVAKFAQQNPLHVAALVAAMLLGGAGASYAVGTLANDVSNIPSNTVVQAVEPLSLQTQTALIETQALRLYRSDVSRSTDSAESLLTRVGVFDTQAAAFMRSNPLVQQTLLGRGGRNLTVEASEDNRLLQLSARWSPDDDGNFKRLSVERTTTGFEARIAALPLSANTRLASGTIQSSLFAATDEAHVPDAVATQLAEIFSGDIDFHRALRKGDRFSVVYEALEGDGEALRSGRVLSAEFVNAGKTYQAMWFQEPPAGASSASRALSKGGYYTLGGTSLRRAFLAAPLEFSRVTSGFKMRLHPILQTMRAHQGVDYGAPTGTPVRTVGDGVVEFAGVQNGFGNVVIVKHGNGNATVYAHLSRIQVRSGQRVNQGQYVGAVGQTGWATGPHLHFEFRVNGVHRDPLTLASRSEATPVAAAARPAFAHAASLVRQQLAAAAQLQATNTQ
ncbi:MAG: M23 family metallopeptidase [Burkholderiales bacterium]|nr:M23 family metallopeptidase [Burkholderiales bacterium]